jgi:hypothetical protein
MDIANEYYIKKTFENQNEAHIILVSNWMSIGNKYLYFSGTKNNFCNALLKYISMNLDEYTPFDSWCNNNCKCDNNNECPDNYGSYCIPYWKWQVYNNKDDYESIVCDMLIQDKMYDVLIDLAKL